MNTAVLQKNGGIVFQDRAFPPLAEGEALIRVLVCGVCSSDIGAYRNGLGEDYILGHEVVGIVEKINGDGAGIAVGDRVTGMIFEGYRPYTVAKVADLLPVPAGLKDEEAIVEPLACLQSGIERVIRPDCGPVAVVGSGYMGLSLIRLLALAGVKDITAVDIKPDLFPLAREMGASRTCHPDECSPDSFAVTFETAGAVPALTLCGRLTAAFGTMVLVGYHPYPVTVPLVEWQEKALVLVNAFESRPEKIAGYGKKALELVAEGKFPTGKLMTHSFAFEELVQALEHQANKPAGYLKSYVRIGN